MTIAEHYEETLAGIVGLIILILVIWWAMRERCQYCEHRINNTTQWGLKYIEDEKGPVLAATIGDLVFEITTAPRDQQHCRHESTMEVCCDCEKVLATAAIETDEIYTEEDLE